VPYIDLGEKFEGNRPAEVKDFDSDAKERYNEEQEEKEAAGKTPGKPWEKLAYETRKKKRYEAIREYEAENGKGSAYKQVKSSTDFAEYFETLDTKDQKEWLGASRYAAYRTGALKLDDLINPDDHYVRSVADLKEAGFVPSKENKMTPIEKDGKLQFRLLTMAENVKESEQFVKVLTEDEILALQRYSSPEGALINNYLRGHLENTYVDKALPQKIQDAILKWTTPDDIILFRGVDERFIQEVFKGEDVVSGDVFEVLGFVSTSIRDLGVPGTPKVWLEIHAPKGTPAAPLTEISYARVEAEWLLRHGTRFRVKSVNDNNPDRLHMVLEVLSSPPILNMPFERKKK
jgi:hypothetical protein